MPEVVTIGETMLRLAAPPGVALEQAPHYAVLAAGAESNVAITLARLGTSAGWISRLPNNPLGRRVAREISAHGVDVSRVIWTENGRVGTYYLEPGALPRPARVIYDRANSAFALISPDEVDWPYVGQARVLHLTGITPALSDACRALAAQAKDQAHKKGTIVSVDVNYRAKLWPADQARAGLAPLLDRAGILLSTKDDGELLLGRSGSAGDISGMLAERYQAGVVLVTDGIRCAAAYDGRVMVKDGYAAESIDRIGAGDAFAGAFIHGFLTEGVDRGLDYGLAAAALKHSYYGDVGWFSKDDLLRLMSGPQRWR